jgi:hypothetical protein
MKNLIILFLIFYQSSLAQQANKVQVAILGTFHFGNSSDFIQSPYSNLLENKKQKEIDAIIKSLAKYFPDKIFVENTPESQEIWDKVYADWKKGLKPKNYEIENNEIFQIGIKLARNINNPFGVICINFQNIELEKNLKQNKYSLLDLHNQAINTELNKKKPNILHLFNENPIAKSELDSYLSDFEKWKKHSLKKHLIEMNQPSNLDRLHYLNVGIWLDSKSGVLGAEYAAREYLRNTKIVQALLNKINPFDQKILLIIGAAHVKSILNMLEGNPQIEVIPIKQVLDL